MRKKSGKKNEFKREFPCTQCGGDAYIGYGSDKGDSLGGKIKKGERLCTKCFIGRGGQRIL